MISGGYTMNRNASARIEVTFSVFFAMNRSRTGGKVERGDRGCDRRVGRPHGDGGLADGARLKSEYRVDGERLRGPGRRRTQPFGLGAVPAGSPHAARVRLESSCRGGGGGGGGRGGHRCRAASLVVSGVMVMMVLLLLQMLLLLLLLMVMVPVLLLVQFEQLRQCRVVLLEQRVLQHDHRSRETMPFDRRYCYYDLRNRNAERARDCLIRVRLCVHWRGRTTHINRTCCARSTGPPRQRRPE